MATILKPAVAVSVDGSNGGTVNWLNPAGAAAEADGQNATAAGRDATSKRLAVTFGGDPVPDNAQNVRATLRVKKTRGSGIGDGVRDEEVRLGGGNVASPSLWPTGVPAWTEYAYPAGTFTVAELNDPAFAAALASRFLGTGPANSEDGPFPSHAIVDAVELRVDHD